MKTREWTLDIFIINEIKSYLKKLILNKDDIVLDLWCNIWAFTEKVSPIVLKVYWYEPDDENFLIMEENLKDCENVKIFKKAVVWHNEKTVDFYINQKTNKWAHSLLVKRWRIKKIVECENINNIMQLYKPTIIKMDIEWGEYDLLKNMIFNWVKQIILEFHFSILKDKNKEKYKEVINILKNNFKNIDYKEDTKWAWTTVIYANNL